ncbi:MAG: class A beta-lactamase [Candidatus Ozemobacteraceae bacterium]
MKLRPIMVCAFLASLVFLAVPGVSAESLQHAKLQKEFARLTRGFDGRVGICVRDSSGVTCVNGGRRFPLQSVMKLLVSIAVLDAVDQRGWKLTDLVVLRKEDLSLAVQPLARLLTEDGFHTTIDDLVRRAIVDSDSAAADFLVARLGGPTVVQSTLDRHRVIGVRFDRDERHLQTEIVGVEWRPEFVDSELLAREDQAVPEARRDAAFRKYQNDPRDTATPRGMAALLQRLAEGKLLSETSTKRLLEIMGQTKTGPDRLKAGVPRGWSLAHKTGTSGTWQGVTAATNDVGILTAPNGKFISVVVFIADSRAEAKNMAKLMADIARVTIENYR